LGPLYQAGTMAGNPASVRAGIACLEVLRDPAVYERMERLGKLLEEGILELAEQAGEAVTVNRVGGAFTVFFGANKVTDYASAQRTDSERFARFFRALLKRGVLLAPSKYEAWFVSAAHTDAEVEQTLTAVRESLAEMQQD
ncbi:MAG: aminotransferase class III-fold pyridoxal phosphate-dependent enzyme, partial [Alicyclobacillus sp.]|nr:aminotransferase class III-fold pyridoxal phosphate-dependent enzyme [Alicyclobacillus sp.]